MCVVCFDCIYFIFLSPLAVFIFLAHWLYLFIFSKPFGYILFPWPIGCIYLYLLSPLAVCVLSPLAVIYFLGPLAVFYLTCFVVFIDCCLIIFQNETSTEIKQGEKEERTIGSR